MFWSKIKPHHDHTTSSESNR